ncbi:MAG: SelB C-terminal domain-containing protein, partial [Chthoniobacterales bacterium]
IHHTKEQLRDTPYSAAPIVAVSARTGHGMGQLKRTLGSLLSNAQPQPNIQKPRLFIDRAFSLPGIGPVVTGTLCGGNVSPNQTVFVQPQGFATRVRSVQTHRANVTVAQPGMRVGVNLADIPKTVTTAGMLRGAVLSTQEDDTSRTVDVVIERSGRLLPSESASRPIKSGAPVHLHHGTRRIPAALILAGPDELRTGQTGIAELRLTEPIVAALGDRFVIRDRSEQHTLGGGVILDPKADPKRFRHEDQQKFLVARAADPNDVKACVASELVRSNSRGSSDLLRNSNFSAEQVDAAVADLAAAGRLVRRGAIVADAGAWKGLCNRAAELIDRTHKVHPQEKGLELTSLRSEFPNLDSAATEALIQDLCTSGFVRRDSAIARASHRTALPLEMQPVAKKIMALLAEKPFDPPGRALLAPDADHRQTVRYLIDQGDIVELGADLVISRETFVLAREIITQFLHARGSATLSQLRQAMNTSRRVTVPLLERFDRERVTRRSGDIRTLAPDSVITVASAPR